MSRDEAKKLLGGYATGTLTRAEEQALFAAALEDQQLFDALAKEQTLRDLLHDPAARGEVLAALDDRPQGWWARATHWIMRPAGLGVATACLVAIVGFGIWQTRQRPAVTHAPALFADNAVAEKFPAPAPPPATSGPVKAEKTPAPEAKPATVTAHSAIAARGRAAARPPDSAPSAAAPAAPVAATPPEKPRDVKVVQPTDQALDARSGAAPQFAPNQAQQRELKQAAPQQAAPQPPPVPQQAQEIQPALRAGRSEVQVTGSQETVTGAVAGQLSANPMAVTWAAFRRDADGTLNPMDLQMIHAGDTIVLRLTPTADGYLTVYRTGQSDHPLLASQRVEKSKPVDLPPLTLGQPGRIELSARVSESGLPGASNAFGGIGMQKRSPPNPASQTITLVFK